MPNPKRRYSHAKQGKNRSHKKLTKPQFSLCPQCQEPRSPHRVCVQCGYYGGQEIIKTEA